MDSATLSSIEREALGELVNIAVGGAATRLRNMVGMPVSLTVPAVSVVPAADVARLKQQLGLGQVTAVRQSFTGRVAGQTLLVFPRGDHHELVRAVVGAQAPQATYEELAEDALGELGNVLLAGFLGTIGAMLRIDFDLTLPTVAHGEAASLFTAAGGQAVLLIYVNFGVEAQSVHGSLALILSVKSFATLREVLAAFIVQSGG